MTYNNLIVHAMKIISQNYCRIFFIVYISLLLVNASVSKKVG